MRLDQRIYFINENKKNYNNYNIKQLKASSTSVSEVFRLSTNPYCFYDVASVFNVQSFVQVGSI